jgi:hypothetical protein
MTSFQFKSYKFINEAIKLIVEYFKNPNKENKCFFANFNNPTFLEKSSRLEEILAFFERIKKNNQQIEFFGFFDIFIVGFGKNGMPFLSMTAVPSNPKFNQTVFISISRGYNEFKKCCALRSTTPSIDLRSSIGNSESPSQPFEDSSFSSGFPSIDRACGPDASPLLQGLSTRFGGGPANGPYSPFQEQSPWSFGAGPAIEQYSPFQEQGHWSFVGGPAIGGGHASNFSFFSSQPTALGGNAMDRTPVCSLFDQNPFTSNASFVPLLPTSEPLRRDKGQLRIVKGRVVRVEIPSDCSSGPSTSSTVGVGGIAKKSPRTQTPIATKIANLEKKISKLESQNPRQGSLDFLELQTLGAKLEKIRNSLL